MQSIAHHGCDFVVLVFGLFLSYKLVEPDVLCGLSMYQLVDEDYPSHLLFLHFCFCHYLGDALLIIGYFSLSWQIILIVRAVF